MQNLTFANNINPYEAVSLRDHDNHQRTQRVEGYVPDWLTDRKQYQRSNAKRRSDRCYSVVTKIWLLEWLSWLLATVSIVGIAIILARFDRRPLPDWPYGITLGALVSLLATIATIGLTEPLAAGVGQAKWMWYSKERRMTDFNLIDEASRGPLKAAWLICHGKGGVSAICGAVLAIIVLTVNPFVQQVIQSASQDVISSDPATVPVATDYIIQTDQIIQTDLNLPMKAAIQRGLLDLNANASTFFTIPNCPTGNCTWPSYTSLAVCGHCTDISMLLTTQENDTLTNSSLPNGLSLEYNPSAVGFITMSVNNTNGMGTPIDSLAYSTWQYPLADVFTIVAPYAYSNRKEDLQGPYASECILQLCVQNLSSTSTNGTFSEKVNTNPVWINNTLDTAQPVRSVDGRNYSIGWNTAKGLQSYFDQIFNTYVKQSNSLSAVSNWPTDGVAQSIFKWDNMSADHLPTQLFNNIASSMSLNIRQASNLTFSGESRSQQTIVIVRWAWMSLPFAMSVLVALYLMMMMVATTKSHLEPWKTSSLPILMHGLSDDVSRNLVYGNSTLAEMEIAADNLQMKTTTTYETNDARAKHIGLKLTQRTQPSENSFQSGSVYLSSITKKDSGHERLYSTQDRINVT